MHTAHSIRTRLCLLTLSVTFFSVLSPSSANATLKVVASLPDLAALAAAVGGDLVEVRALSSEAQDPHYVDARPSLLLPLRAADLLIVNGLDLETGWLPQLIVNSRNAKLRAGSNGYLDASSVVTKRDIVKADRAKGDIHPGGNPHFLHDPTAALAIASLIAKRLAVLDPSQAAVYAKNAKRFQKKLRYVMAVEAKRFRALPAPRKQVVTYHRSLSYLTAWLGLKSVATIEPKPGVKPNPGHVGFVLKTMKSTGAKVVVQEAFYPRKTGQILARLAGGSLALVPGGTQFRKGETYILRTRRTAKVLYDALSK